MNLWKAFVRWLARKEIGEAGALAFEAIAEAGAARQLADMHKKLAFAEGQRQGHKEAFDSMEQQVYGRTDGYSDVVMPEDLKRAMKGLLH
jgi:flagellar biosynthesis/type III secretory pathway protein FliH